MFRKKIILGQLLLKNILLNKKIPFVISWTITYRCNLSCKYCGVHYEPPELNTEEVLKIIDSLSKRGTKIIRFTGGEPLVRDDIATIISHSNSLGILTFISTNGILFADTIKNIGHLDGISISLDGPRVVNDSIRGDGSFDKALEALTLSQERRIPRTISTVLSAHNIESIDYILRIAEQFNAVVFFQPATRTLLYNHLPNPLAPSVVEYRKAIRYLIKIKKKNKHIGNSFTGLAYLSHWPDKSSINCVAGKFFIRIDPRGNVYACNRAAGDGKKLNIIENGLSYCLDSLRPPYCNNCWCVSFVEFNLISGLNFDAIVNMIKINSIAA